MKKLIICLLALSLTACTVKPIFEDKDSLKIAVTNDIHYFAKEYYEECTWFDEQMMYSDGKMVTYMDQILDAFMNSLIDNNVDMVILNGDLTFNGEVNSHKTLAEILNKFEENGITVAVTPGNHDIDNIFTKGYGVDDYFEVENINAKDFKNIYKNLGYDLAVSEHNESLSYEVILNEEYSLMMLDTNSHELTTNSALDTGGQLTDSTLDWLKIRLEETKNNNRTPIIVMHHNLGIHNERLFNGYTIDNYEEVSTLFNSYNIPLVLSGHIHLQSIADMNGIKDIASSALSINPLQYGLIDITNDKITYKTTDLDIGIDSAEYFEINAEHLFFSDDVEIEHLDEIKEVILFANRNYFAGTIKDVKKEIMEMKGYSILMSLDDDNRYKKYLLNVLSKDDNYKELGVTKFSWGFAKKI